LPRFRCAYNDAMLVVIDAIFCSYWVNAQATALQPH
jgi:hypothetical protein